MDARFPKQPSKANQALLAKALNGAKRNQQTSRNGGAAVGNDSDHSAAALVDADHEAAAAGDSYNNASADGGAYGYLADFDAGRTAELPSYDNFPSHLFSNAVSNSRSEHAPIYLPQQPQQHAQQASTLVRTIPASMAFDHGAAAGAHLDAEANRLLHEYDPRVDKMEKDVEALQEFHKTTVTAVDAFSSKLLSQHDLFTNKVAALEAERKSAKLALTALEAEVGSFQKTATEVDVLTVRFDAAHTALATSVGALQAAHESTQTNIAALETEVASLKRSRDDANNHSTRLYKAETSIAELQSMRDGLTAYQAETRVAEMQGLRDGLATKNELNEAIAALRQGLASAPAPAPPVVEAAVANPIGPEFVLEESVVKRVKTPVTPFCRHRSLAYYRVTRGETLSIIVCKDCLAIYCD